MGVCFRLNLNWVFSFNSSSSSSTSSHSFRGGEGRVSFPYVTYGEREGLNEDSLRARTCSSAPHLLENDYAQDIDKMSISNILCGDIYKTINFSLPIKHKDDKAKYLNSLEVQKSSQYTLLLKNLDVLEEMFDDSDLTILQSNILLQLERLGALHLFRTCLIKSLDLPTVEDLSKQSDCESIGSINDDRTAKTVVCSGKKEGRKIRNERRVENAKNASNVGLNLKMNAKRSKRTNNMVRRSPNRMGRFKFSMNEAEMSNGVKLASDLEKVKMRLENEAGGEIPNLNRWAEACGLEKKVLQDKLLFGSFCQDQLLKSTRSLVLYIARNYRGLGVAFDDLIQAGYIGVLQGAERFDVTRGYKFSTYVQYWIRKSILTFIADHSRGIRVPVTLSKAINKIQKARKALDRGDREKPDDVEIAKFTGLSMATIKSAVKCIRVVGSLDHKIGHFDTSPKFMEVTADTTVETPEKYVLRQHLVNNLHEVLDGLDPRERRILILRFGLNNHQRKSLEEIGKEFCVTKEWIRKIERAALTKLRTGDSCKDLIHFLYMM